MSEHFSRPEISGSDLSRPGQRKGRSLLRSLLVLSAALGSLTALGEAGAASYTDLAVFKDIDLSNSRDPRISKFYVGDTVRY